jgi:DNA polymerase III epsilon subunit-like protein
MSSLPVSGTEVCPPDTTVESKVPTNVTNDAGSLFYLLGFDLETTGLSKFNDSVVEVGVVFKLVRKTEDRFVSVGQDPVCFQQRCKPRIDISPHASLVTGITNDNVSECHSIAQTMENLVTHANIHLQQGIPRLLVSYNGTAFDVPLLVNDLLSISVDAQSTFRQLKLELSLDLLVVARKYLDTTCLLRQASGRCSYRLGSVYMSVFQKNLVGAHGAIADSQAVVDLIMAPEFFEGVVECLQDFFRNVSYPTVSSPAVVFEVGRWVTDLSKSFKVRSITAGPKLSIKQKILSCKRKPDVKQDDEDGISKRFKQ